MDQQKPFIIVVDDDDEDRYLVNHCFTEMGLDENVKFFGDALQFIRYTELIGSLNVRPSLIIMDYKMPYMNGKAVVNYLKSNSPFRDTPVVILSSTLTNDVREKLFDLGVSACYDKGAGYDELSARLHEMVKLALPVESR
jgi:CheY-like chemotaxis protein